VVYEKYQYIYHKMADWLDSSTCNVKSTGLSLAWGSYSLGTLSKSFAHNCLAPSSSVVWSCVHFWTLEGGQYHKQLYCIKWSKKPNHVKSWLTFFSFSSSSLATTLWGNAPVIGLKPGNIQKTWTKSSIDVKHLWCDLTKSGLCRTTAFRDNGRFWWNGGHRSIFTFLYIRQILKLKSR